MSVVMLRFMSLWSFRRGDYSKRKRRRRCVWNCRVCNCATFIYTKIL